jgi:hypothetical protein
VNCGSIRDDAAMLADTADDENAGDTDVGNEGEEGAANAISSNIGTIVNSKTLHQKAHAMTKKPSQCSLFS